MYTNALWIHTYYITAMEKELQTEADVDTVEEKHSTLVALY